MIPRHSSHIFISLFGVSLLSLVLICFTNVWDNNFDLDPDDPLFRQSRWRSLLNVSPDQKTVDARLPSPRSNIDESPTLFYLEGAHQVAGLGHSFLSFNNLIHQMNELASQYNLLVRAKFAPNYSRHGISAERSYPYFFADVLMAGIPEGWECMKIPVSVWDLGEKVLLAEEKIKQNSVQCVIFELAAANRGIKHMDIQLPYFRKVFEQNQGEVRRSVISRKWEDSPPEVFNVAVHIRRGDLIQWLRIGKYRHEAAQRLFVASAYTSVLNQLFSVMAKYGVKDINVHIFCEGMEGPAQIPSVSGEMIDLREEIKFDASNQDVTFLPGDTDSIQAFDDMCHSDILITGGSSFSYMVAYFCSTPVVLAMPAPVGLSYDSIPNALVLDLGWGDYEIRSPVNDTLTLVDHAAFDETRFDEIWRNKVGSIDGSTMSHGSPN